MFLVQMPAARARNEDRHLALQPVCLPLLYEADGPAHGIVQVDLAFDHVGPRGAVGILEIRHESRGPRVERVPRSSLYHSNYCASAGVSPIPSSPIFRVIVLRPMPSRPAASMRRPPVCARAFAIRVFSKLLDRFSMMFVSPLTSLRSASRPSAASHSPEGAAASSRSSGGKSPISMT